MKKDWVQRGGCRKRPGVKERRTLPPGEVRLGTWKLDVRKFSIHESGRRPYYHSEIAKTNAPRAQEFAGNVENGIFEGERRKRPLFIKKKRN